MLRNPIFKFFASLKLAVFSILTLAGVLATATIFESMYGMRASHVMIYGTWWFLGVLVLLALNVLCAALSRYPWKRSQTGFVLTHLGIITMLVGAFLTERFGVDGNLPVVQGDKENQVILSELKLSIADEEGKVAKEIRVPETGREATGALIRVDVGNGARLVLDRFLPRAVAQTKVAPSPLPGVGMPAVHVELFNSRFRVQEWLFHQSPDKTTELNLGPAMLTFRKLWSADEEKAFLDTTSPKLAAESKADPLGFVLVEYGGHEFRVGVKAGLKKWTRLGASPIELRVDQYLPYAVVQNNQLVSKTDEPVNPAVNLTLRSKAGGEEKHTAFVNFPEFATLHRAHQKAGQHALGVKVRMVGPEESQQKLSFVGNNRGRMEFAQSADNRRLLYLVHNASGAVTAQGAVKVGEEIPTGWMDLQFRVMQWEPSGIAEEVPQYVDLIEGQGESNFISALHLTSVSDRGTASESKGTWLTEGSSRMITVGDHRLQVYYGRERLALPFSIFLNKFTMGTDPGTSKAATYQSEVTVKDPVATGEKQALISMNEPLDYGGYTFYQASYQMQEGQAPLSVFAVNYDPGRRVKYLGAIIMVLGILLMFYLNPQYLDKLLKPKGGPA